MCYAGKMVLIDVMKGSIQAALIKIRRACCNCNSKFLALLFGLADDVTQT